VDSKSFRYRERMRLFSIQSAKKNNSRGSEYARNFPFGEMAALIHGQIRRICGQTPFPATRAVAKVLRATMPTYNHTDHDVTSVPTTQRAM